MSEVEQQATSILLPTSGIAVYSKDQTTLNSANALADDWRFARVSVSGVEGDVESAIASYQDAASPDLIIIQTDTIDDGFTERLGALAANCNEGTSAIVVGPDNDVNLYRKLIEMGVSDYMVRPVETPDLADVVSKALISKIGVTGSRLIAVMGTKGGVGASVLSEALASGVADLLGQKTMLMDTAGGWSTFSVGLGFEPLTTLSEAVRAAENNDEDNLKRMIHAVDDKLSVLATGSDVMLEPAVKPEQIETLIDMFMVKYPVVIVDLSQSSEDLQKTVLRRANQILLTSTPTLPSLRLARVLLQEIREIRGGDDSDVKLVVNMQGQSPKLEVTKADIEKAMDFSISAYLPYDPQLFLGNESASRKLSEDKNADEILRKTILPLVGDVISLDGLQVEAAPEANILDSLISKLTKKA